MLPQKPLFVILVSLIDCILLPAPSKKRGRGQPKVYPDVLIVKALVIMVIRRMFTAYSLLAFLEHETALTQELCSLLTNEQGRFPTHPTWER